MVLEKQIDSNPNSPSFNQERWVRDTSYDNVCMKNIYVVAFKMKDDTSTGGGVDLDPGSDLGFNTIHGLYDIYTSEPIDKDIRITVRASIVGNPVPEEESVSRLINFSNKTNLKAQNIPFKLDDFGGVPSWEIPTKLNKQSYAYTTGADEKPSGEDIDIISFSGDLETYNNKKIIYRFINATEKVYLPLPPIKPVSLEVNFNNISDSDFVGDEPSAKISLEGITYNSDNTEAPYSVPSTGLSFTAGTNNDYTVLLAGEKYLYKSSFKAEFRGVKLTSSLYNIAGASIRATNDPSISISGFVTEGYVSFYDVPQLTTSGEKPLYKILLVLSKK